MTPWLCERCGWVLHKLPDGDEFADWKCVNQWCGRGAPIYYTTKHLEDEKEVNGGEEDG